MRTIEYLFGDAREIFLPGAIAGAAVAIQCALLSVLVVLRRLAFVGQGVSHAALGGVGIAAVLGLSGVGTLICAGGVCVLSALGIGVVSHRRGDREGEREDAAIGVFLAASMALGAALLAWRAQRPIEGAPPVPGWESLLFGSILSVGPASMWAAWIVGAMVVGTLVLVRRPMLFWAFDEEASRVFGGPGLPMRLLLMALLGATIVVTMRLSGVVLVGALLVLPGAAALRLSRRLGWVLAISCAVALGGVAGGLTLSFEMDLPPGASIALVLTALYALAWLPARLRRGRSIRLEPNETRPERTEGR